MSALLDVLVCTLNGREHWCDKLCEHFAPQLTDEVNLIFDRDGGEVSIGVKRQRMLENAKAKYIAFFDDDDTPHPRYCELILKALEQDPDVVGFKIHHYLDGYLAPGIILSNTHNQVTCDPHFGYMRHVTNHLNPVRRSMALDVGYQDSNMGEDTDYAYRFAHRFRDIREVFIDEYLYDYYYRRRRDGEMTNRKLTGRSTCVTQSQPEQSVEKFVETRSTTPTLSGPGAM